MLNLNTDLLRYIYILVCHTVSSHTKFTGTLCTHLERICSLGKILGMPERTPSKQCLFSEGVRLGMEIFGDVSAQFHCHDWGGDSYGYLLGRDQGY